VSAFGGGFFPEVLFRKVAVVASGRIAHRARARRAIRARCCLLEDWWVWWLFFLFSFLPCADVARTGIVCGFKRARLLARGKKRTSITRCLLFFSFFLNANVKTDGEEERKKKKKKKKTSNKGLHRTNDGT